MKRNLKPSRKKLELKLFIVKGKLKLFRIEYPILRPSRKADNKNISELIFPSVFDIMTFIRPFLFNQNQWMCYEWNDVKNRTKHHVLFTKNK